MDTSTSAAPGTTGFKALLQAWMLTLVCPGLGQIRLGAKARGGATLVVVCGSLVWLAMAYLSPVRDFFASKAAAMARPPDGAMMLSWATDPALWKRLEEVSTLPGWLFLLSFCYSFADAAYLALYRKS